MPAMKQHSRNIAFSKPNLSVFIICIAFLHPRYRVSSLRSPSSPYSATPYYIYDGSVELNAPNLQVAVLRKPCKKDIDTPQPTHYTWANVTSSCLTQKFLRFQLARESTSLPSGSFPLVRKVHDSARIHSQPNTIRWQKYKFILILPNNSTKKSQICH